MRHLFLALLLSLTTVFAQSLDFGFEFKVNTNIAQILKNDGTLPGISRPGYYNGNVDQFHFPAQNAEFYADDGLVTFGYYSGLQVSNNFEIPIVLKYSTKKNWFFSLKLSRSSFDVTATGTFYKSPEYYDSLYGDFYDFLAQEGENFNNFPINYADNSAYSPEEAFIRYFSEQLDSDPITLVSLQHVQQVRLNSIYLGFGYKFLKHKVIHPYFNFQAGYRQYSRTYRRQYFNIYNPDATATPIKQDLSVISKEVSLYGHGSVSSRLEFGLELYRYYAGASFETNVSITKKEPTTALLQFSNVMNGMFTYSFHVGMYLFSADLATRSAKSVVYADEFKSLSSQLGSQRSLGFGINVEASLLNNMTNFGDRVIWQHQDIIDTTTNTLDYRMHLLGLREITKIDWSPKIEMGVRFSPHSRFEFEVQAGFSRVEFDTDVRELNGVALIDTTSSVYSPLSTLNYASYRNRFMLPTVGLNLYVKVVETSLLDVKLFGGFAVNYPLRAEIKNSTIGVNGNGTDVYSIYDNFYWDSDDLQLVHGQMFWSDYSEDFTLDQTPNEHIDLLNTSGSNRIQNGPRQRRRLFFNASFGVEAEVNRFLVGLSGDFSVGGVENVFIKNYFNLNASLGYLLFTKNKINKKISGSE